MKERVISTKKREGPNERKKKGENKRGKEKENIG